MKAMTRGAFALLAVLIATSAFAKGPTAQQERMKSCNAEAKEKTLKGPERKEFMRSCLKGETGMATTAQPSTQQNKMKTCNADAKDKGLKGAERKEFMRNCLKG